MKISVVIPTYRVGGLDVVFDSLQKQTHQDFELVVVDAIHSLRAPHVEHLMAKYGFPYRYLAPSGGVHLSNYSRSINDALAHCSGDLVVIQADYTWFPPECLEVHARCHANSPKACFMLDNHCTALPPLHPSFTSYGPNWEGTDPTPAERTENERKMNEAAFDYSRDLHSGKLNSVMWSLFEKPLTNEEVMALPITRSHLKQGQPIDPNWASLKNESMPIEAFLSINGMDEDFDNSHLYQDQEVAWRMHRAGYSWTTAPGGEAYMVNPRSVIYAKILSRPMMENKGIMDRKQGTGEAINPHRNIRQERSDFLKRSAP